MNIEQFNFELPERLIAQSPLPDRKASNLLVLNQSKEEINHDKFSNITNYFKKGDCLVLNNTRVIPARLYGIKSDTSAKIEVLLLKEVNKDEWETLVKPARKVKVGTEVIFGNGELKAVCIEEKDQGGRVFRLVYNGILMEILDILGDMPLPPYIKEQLNEKDRYQTVYAKVDGSAAAPTAGLHFTSELLEQIKAIGVSIAYVTLHVGLGTFRPVQVDRIEDHHMHEEYYMLDEENAQIINNVKQNGGRIIAVGTTSIRVLETIAQTDDQMLKATSGWTDIFIYPPYNFKLVDGLITNFHLPKSTLLMLVSAFSSRELILRAYEEAIQNEYRFFSFGDSMFILPKEE